MTSRKKPVSGQFISAIIVLLLLASCVTHTTASRPERGSIVPWQELPGWDSDEVSQIWPVMKKNCGTEKLPEGWQNICKEMRLLDDPDNDTVRAYLETRFTVHELENPDAQEGLMTGYYEPVLNGSLKASARFRYPVYSRPKNLVTVRLSELYPELEGKTVRGMLRHNEVVPFYSRKEIDSGAESLSGLEIAWVDNAVDLFFLHIQGSGKIRLTDGRILSVGYVDQNGHPYESIGTRLVQRGELKAEDVSLFTIKDWLDDHPDEAMQLLYSNPSYIFFSVRDNNLPGPIGSLGVPLTAERSIAIDRKFIELGSLVWVDTTLPGEVAVPYQRLMAAQDTGGAINGAVRADIFFGQGERARNLAGHMKQPGRLFVFEVINRRIKPGSML